MNADCEDRRIDLGRSGRDRAGSDRALLVVADSDILGSRAIADAEIANVRLLGRVAWADAADRINQQAGKAIVLLEMSAAGESVIATQMPGIEAGARAVGAPLIACFDSGQIDLAAALLPADEATLLCDATTAERAAAISLAIAVADERHLHERFRENDTARLARLNDEVARIAEVLNRLSLRGPEGGVLGRGDVADRRQGFDAGPAVASPANEPGLIRPAIRARRMRDQIVGEGLFEDPAWDMLLDLFAAHLERAQVSVSSLCIAAAVAPTTALRWIGKLTSAGLIERHPDPFDRRRVFMALTGDAQAKMRSYVAALTAAGLPVV